MQETDHHNDVEYTPSQPMDQLMVQEDHHEIKLVFFFSFFFLKLQSSMGDNDDDPYFIGYFESYFPDGDSSIIVPPTINEMVEEPSNQSMRPILSGGEGRITTDTFLSIYMSLVPRYIFLFV